MVHLDDRILPTLGFSRDHNPGRKPVLKDVELRYQIVSQYPLGIASHRLASHCCAMQRKRIRYAHTQLLGMFPNLPQPSGWSKRVRQATGLLSAVFIERARLPLQILLRIPPLPDLHPRRDAHHVGAREPEKWGM